MRWTGAFPVHGIVSVHTEEHGELREDAIEFQPLDGTLPVDLALMPKGVEHMSIKTHIHDATVWDLPCHTVHRNCYRDCGFCIISGNFGQSLS